MNVLMVYPEFPDTFWSFKHSLPFQGKRSAYPPLGLLTVSALLPRQWQKRVVDMNVRPLKDSDFDWADVVFFSGMMVQGPSMKRAIHRAKQRGRKTVVGGPITSAHDPAISEADYVVEGEAEEIVPALARDLERGEAKPFYKAPELPDLTKVPLPDLELAELKPYSAMAVQYSRGCPFTCEFCDIIEIYGRRPRTKSPEQILAEFERLYELGWRGSLFLVDDNFIGNKKNVKLLMPHLVKWMRDHRYPFSLYTEASLNLAEDGELLGLMREARFTRVFLGIETPVEESLKETTKYQNLRGDLLESVKLIQSYGIEVMGGFIVGFDNDPPDVFERQIRFIREAAIPLSMVGLLTALPNTQLWRRLKAEGRLLKQSVGNNTLPDLNFIPKMDTHELLAGYERILKTIYNPREYFLRSLASLAHLGASARLPVVFSDVLAVMRSLWWQGLRSSYRKEYWKFLVRALQSHREHLDKAFRLAILGHHFFALTAKTISKAESLIEGACDPWADVSCSGP
ncbi:MAG: B12-binding domain-containing radical SAM protein [Acidobacteria bacterium]|nr:MAG: B12-binding domain-containing radical SAM protein [Acidobacteriota bacterium]